MRRKTLSFVGLNCLKAYAEILLFIIHFKASGKIIPKGASIALLLYAMGHNPKTFENPTVFNPDRFLQDDRDNKNKYELVPFSAGPRNCIGKTLTL